MQVIIAAITLELFPCIAACSSFRIELDGERTPPSVYPRATHRRACGTAWSLNYWEP